MTLLKALAVYVGLYTGPFLSSASFLELHDFVDTPEKGVAGFTVDVHVLAVRRKIGDDEHFCVTRLTVEIAAREKKRIAVQIVEHVTVFQAAPEFLEDQDILTIVGVKGVLVVRDTVTIDVAELVHDRTGLAGACLAEYVRHFQVTPGGSKLSIPVHGADTLDFVDVLVGAGNSVHNLDVTCAVLEHVHDLIGVPALALMLLGHFAFFLERVGEVHAVMVFAAGIGVVVRAVRLFIELLAVFQDIGPVFGTGAVGALAVEVREQLVDTLSGAGTAQNKENVGVPCLALVALLVAQAEVKQAFELMEGGFYGFMIEAVFLGIVDCDLPLSALDTGHAVSHMDTTLKKLQNYRSRGRVILGLPRPVGLRPTGYLRRGRWWWNGGRTERVVTQGKTPRTQAALGAVPWAVVGTWMVYIQM